MNFSFNNLKTRIGVLVSLLAAMVLGVTLAGSALADDDQPNPYLKMDDSWITISGTVDSVKPNSFMLDYGEGRVLVEMDDGDRDADAYKLLKGDKVTVNGRIDDDFFELTKIEAGSVYVENLGTTFFASSVDEESYDDYFIMLPEVPLSQAIVRGTVTDVNEDEFMLNTGKRMLRVDVSDMYFDPLDDEGYMKIEKGDHVRVYGEITVDLFDGRELEADSVIKLHTNFAS